MFKAVKRFVVFNGFSVCRHLFWRFPRICQCCYKLRLRMWGFKSSKFIKYGFVDRGYEVVV